MVVEYILDSLRIKLLEIFLVAVFAVIFLRYVLRRKENPVVKKISGYLNYGRIACVLVFFRFLYACFLTTAQYLVWAGSDNPAIKIFSTAPLDRSVPLPKLLESARPLLENKYGYFIFYAFGRFWMNFFITVGFCLLFWYFLVLLKKYRARFFEEGETELGLAVSLVIGWPGVVVFIPLLFLFVVLISIFKTLFFREKYTTLGWPFLCSGITTMLFGHWMLAALGLAITLKI